jgi:hypothetical protein
MMSIIKEHNKATIKKGFVLMKNRLKALLASLLSFRIRVFALVFVGMLLWPLVVALSQEDWAE